jgi:hypothetical protein
MKDNLIHAKSYGFAIRIVRLYQLLTQKKKEFVLRNSIRSMLKLTSSVGLSAVFKRAPKQAHL